MIHLPPMLQGPFQAQQGLTAGGTGRGQIRTHLHRKGMRCIDHPLISPAVLQQSPDRLLALQRSDVQMVKLETVVGAGGGAGGAAIAAGRTGGLWSWLCA